MTMSKTKVNQGIGDINRVHPNQQRPYIIDMIDPYQCFEFQRQCRISYYKGKGYKVMKCVVKGDDKS